MVIVAGKKVDLGAENGILVGEVIGTLGKFVDLRRLTRERLLNRRLRIHLVIDSRWINNRWIDRGRLIEIDR